jgi:hypothetical protein
VKLAAADVMDEVAALLQAPQASCSPLHAARERLHAGLAALLRATTARLPADEGGVVTALDPSFRAQELAFVVTQIATNTEYAAAAERRGWLDRLAGRQPEGFTGPWASLQERAGAHARWSSSWLQNSTRGAVALALAVMVADVGSVQHGFWVVFGTLGVLRSNALSTGQNILRAILGTTAGFIVGGVLVWLIGTNTAVLWVLLPFIVLFAGMAPATISFAAGQAAFTMTLLILFNLLVPVGWKIGIVRVEDVAIGSSVSLCVGLLLWPRGAAAALGRALSQAYTESVGYLGEAVAYGVGRCDTSAPQTLAPSDRPLQAAAAARRLDDTFRGYLTERGAKPIPLAAVTSLVTGVAGVRIAADSVVELWSGDARGGDRAAARQELLRASDAVSVWFGHFASSLTDCEPVPDPLMADAATDGRLIDAVAHDLRDQDGNATATGVKVIWTGDHLDAVRRLQETLVGPARAAVAEHALADDTDLAALGFGRLALRFQS